MGTPTLLLFHNGNGVGRYNASEFSVSQLMSFIRHYTDQEITNINVTSQDFRVSWCNSLSLLLLPWSWGIVCNKVHIPSTFMNDGFNYIFPVLLYMTVFNFYYVSLSWLLSYDRPHCLHKWLKQDRTHSGQPGFFSSAVPHGSSSPQTCVPDWPRLYWTTGVRLRPKMTIRIEN